jgi:hypothetical protein
MELMLTTGTQWFYQAHHHENGTECPEYAEVIYASPVPRSPVPMSCLAENCLPPPYSTSLAAPAVGLDGPISATDDLDEILSTSRSTKLDEAAGNITLPDGRKIHVRVGVFKIKVPVAVDGVEKEVTEYFGFGMESADTGRDEIHAQKVTEHMIGSAPQKNLYEFHIGTLKCVVLTVK